jgi:hypothetical protein
MNQNIRWTRQLLNVSPLQVALLLLVVVSSLPLGALFELLVNLVGLVHPLLAASFDQLIVLFDYNLDCCALIVLNEVIHLSRLAQVVAPGEELVDVEVRVRVLVEVLAQP